MNKHVELVKKWLADPESATKEELDKNLEAASLDVEGNVGEAKFWVKKYEERVENGITILSDNRVATWNAQCGNLPALRGSDEYYDNLKNQAARLQEELNELIEGLQNEDDGEILDALVDIDVVLSGAKYISRHDCDGAFNAVCDNNDLKRSTDRDLVEDYLFKMEKQTREELVLHTSIHNGVEYYSIHRSSDNKILKFPDHPKVDLDKFLFKG